MRALVVFTLFIAGGCLEIHDAARANAGETIKTLVEAGKAVDGELDSRKQTALHVAAGHGHVAAIEALVEVGAAMEAKDTQSWTPLHHAAFRGHSEAINALVNAGAGVDTKADLQWTPLHVAAAEGHTEAIKALLEAGAAIEAQTDRKRTAMHMAAGGGHPEAIKVLVEAGSSIEALDHLNWTPLLVAVSERPAFEGHRQAIEALMAAAKAQDDEKGA